MALASALAFEARKLPVRAGGITVDHGLQDGSDVRRRRGGSPGFSAMDLGPVESVAVTVGREGGPEAAARDGQVRRAWTPQPSATARPPSCSATPATTRPRPSSSPRPRLRHRSLSGMAAVSGAAGR